MPMKSEDIEIINKKGMPLSGRLYHAHNTTEGAIFCHGLFSSKDAYKIVNMAEHIVKAGYTLLTFDFSFARESGGDFKELSILQEVEDLRAAVDLLLSRGINGFHLIGSSMGGVVAAIFSAERHSLLKSLSLIATPAKLPELLGKILPVEKIPFLSNEGSTEVEGIPVGNRFFKEALHIDMEARLDSIRVPTLILHGIKDALVDVSNVEYMSRMIRSEKSIFIVDGGEHHLNRNEDLLFMQEKIVNWLNRHSKGNA